MNNIIDPNMSPNLNFLESYGSMSKYEKKYIYMLLL
jgi:hypothetical protein